MIYIPENYNTTSSATTLLLPHPTTVARHLTSPPHRDPSIHHVHHHHLLLPLLAPSHHHRSLSLTLLLPHNLPLATGSPLPFPANHQNHYHPQLSQAPLQSQHHHASTTLQRHHQQSDNHYPPSPRHRCPITTHSMLHPYTIFNPLFNFAVNHPPPNTITRGQSSQKPPFKTIIIVPPSQSHPPSSQPCLSTTTSDSFSPVSFLSCQPPSQLRTSEAAPPNRICSPSTLLLFPAMAHNTQTNLCSPRVPLQVRTAAA